MDIYSELAQKIISEQETIIGPVAIEQARKVEGLVIDQEAKTITFNGDKKTILEKLVKAYESLFGLTSVEVCKDAVKDIVSHASRDLIPQVLL